MSKGIYAQEIKLNGSPTADGNRERIDLLSNLLDQAQSKVNHFDNLRQAYLTVALAIFAAVFAFGAQMKNTLTANLAASSLSFVMAILLIVDHQLHRYSEGWQGTSAEFIRRLEAVINEPSKDVHFLTYWPQYEEQARWWSLRPLLYLLLTAGGAVGIPGVRYFSG